jgi:hypothetical protein
LGICLPVCCVISFLSAAFGDAWENTKHQFQFNLLLDACLIFALAVACQRLAIHRLAGRSAPTGPE